MIARQLHHLTWVLALALLLLPALCLGGLLEHACECDRDVTPCQHEASCLDDPCASIPAPKEKEWGDSLVSCAIPEVATPLALAQKPASIPPVRPVRAVNLLPHESDRPLLN
ncbi:MAG: hypothetical protein RL885_01325 [Planctomycetota bacterium]